MWKVIKMWDFQKARAIISQTRMKRKVLICIGQLLHVLKMKIVIFYYYTTIS